MFQHLAIPTVDPFSYTMPGAPWIAHEWLAEILYAAAYSLGGWSAIVGLAAAAFATALAILTRYLLRHLEPLYALVLTSMAFSLASPHLLARPHTLAAPLLVYWTVALLRARESNRAPPLWVALLMVLWANLHGSFVFGLALGGVFSAEAVLTAEGSAARWHAARQWSGFLLAALLASMVNPHGPYSLLFAYDLSQMNFISQVSEWMSDQFRPGAAVRNLAAHRCRGLADPRTSASAGALGPADRPGPYGIAPPATPGSAWLSGAGDCRRSARCSMVCGPRSRAATRPVLDRLFASFAPPATRVACAMVCGRSCGCRAGGDSHRRAAPAVHHDPGCRIGGGACCISRRVDALSEPGIEQLRICGIPDLQWHRAVHRRPGRHVRR